MPSICFAMKAAIASLVGCQDFDDERRADERRTTEERVGERENQVIREQDCERSGAARVQARERGCITRVREAERLIGVELLCSEESERAREAEREREPDPRRSAQDSHRRP